MPPVMSMDAPVMYGAVNILVLGDMQADQMREEQAETAGFLACTSPRARDAELTPKACGEITWAAPTTQPC